MRYPRPERLSDGLRGEPRRRGRKGWVFAAFALLALIAGAGLWLASPDEDAGPDQEKARAAIFGEDAKGALSSVRPVAAPRPAYLPMRDGTLLAVDVWAPADLKPGEKLPALVMPTRYWRRWDIRFPFDLAGRLLGRTGNKTERFFAARGYVVVTVDARGTGASFGSQPHPWSKAELEDYRQVLDWITAQPWSSGRAGALGASYGGTAAEFMATLGHPALKAVAPRFSLYDAYADIAFPGGILNEGFVREWARLNALLDAGRVPEGLSRLAEWAARGPAPGADVGGQQAEALLQKAVAAHAANVDIHAAAKPVVSRDEHSPKAGSSVDGFSPHARQDRLDMSGVAVFGWAGWGDGTYADAVLKRFMSVRTPQRAVIGPWNHGATAVVDPFLPQTPKAAPAPDRAPLDLELLRFFNYWLKNEGQPPAREIVYFTHGENRWKRAERWPPEGHAPKALYLDGPGKGQGRLNFQPPESETGEDAYVVDFSAGTGRTNRWRTQLNRGEVLYPDRAAADAKLLIYDSAPLEADLELTGHPSVTLFLTANARDLAVHAYLEAVDPSGNVRMLTEGGLRALHRNVSFDEPPYEQFGPYHTYRSADLEPLEPGEQAKLSIGMLPLSVRVPKGWRIRLALAGADADQFARVGQETAPNQRIEWRVARNAITPSFLELPVIDAAAAPAR